MVLLRLTAESMRFDHDTLGLAMPAGRDLLRYHYPHLFIGPKKSPELCLNGDQHAQTALRILEFLCDHKRHSLRRAPGRPPRYLMPRTISMLTSINFPRKRREEKHRYGVTFKLSIPDVKNDRALFPPLPPAERRNHMQNICVLGLSYLPAILTAVFMSIRNREIQKTSCLVGTCQDPEATPTRVPVPPPPMAPFPLSSPLLCPRPRRATFCCTRHRWDSPRH
ncbi:hypothetical protein BJ912DRAFT_476984 [Pholiota molesta]|nr:hypothetical protein BJ912DRAFT_476984 [Pholiota molesta]